MINLKIDPEFQSQIPPLTDDEFKQLEENILKEGKLLSPLIVWGNTLVDGHNRYEIVQEHPEISFSTMPFPFESREEVLAWICKNQLGRRNITPEQKKFLIGKQYSVEHRKPGGNGNNQHTVAANKTAPEEASVRKQIVHEILHPEDRPAPQKRIYGINYSALEAAVRRIQQDVDFLMKYLPKVPDDAYVKVETTKILKQHKAYMAQFEEMLNDEKVA